MPDDRTPNLELPYIAAAQAQKHVTHNEAIRDLDAIVQLAVLARDIAAPPASPAEGDRYIVGASPTGAFTGEAGQVAAFQDGAWTFHAPRTGWLAWIASESKLRAFNGAAWVEAGGGSLNPAPLVGVNATADAANRLAISSAAALFSHEGAGHQLKINKALAANTASLLFQTNFSGRAEIGTTGDDNLRVKVSADGTTWRDAILIDRTTGQIAFPGTPGAIAANPWNGRKHAACGTEVTASGVYTTPLAALLGATTVNLGQNGGTLGTTPAGGLHTIYDSLATIPADADLVTLECGVNDFSAGVPLGAAGDETLSTFYGALLKSARDILAANAKRTLVFLTPFVVRPTATGAGGATFPQYARAIADVARMMGCPCADTGGEAGVNAVSAALYLDAAGLTPNADGGQRIARYVFNKLLTVQPASSTLTTPGSPTFAPAAGSYSGVQSVAIAPAQFGAAIRYTIDGSTPSATSPLYTGPVTVNSSLTLKAIATLGGFASSAPASASYTIALSPDQALLAGLPASPTGVWAFDALLASPSPVVKNLVNAGAAPSANLFRGSRRMFANTEFWGGQNRTMVDEAVAGPDGVTDASTLASTSANWTLTKAVTGAANIPAGTYTLGVSAMRNTSSDQPFAFTANNTATRSPAKTATSAWQRFSWTFTLASATSPAVIGLCSSDGATGASLQIRDLELYSGAVDPGPASPDGHAYGGTNAFDPKIAGGTGYVDLSTGGYFLIQFPASSTSGPFTAQAVLSKVAAGTNYSSFLSRVQGYGQFSAMAEYARGPVNTKGQNVFPQAPGQGVGLWERLNRGWHVLTHRYDGTTAELWLDDIRMFATTGALASFQLRDLFVNITSSVSLYGGERYHGIAYWPRAISNAEIAGAFAAWKARAALSSLTLNGDTANRVVVFEGDSRTALITGFPYICGQNASPAVFGVDLAVTGSTLANLAARQTAVRDTIPANKNGRKIVVVIGPMGANDLAGFAGATDAIAAQNYANALAALADAYYGYGADRVIVSTELAVYGSTTHNARRALLNTIIRAAWPGANAVGVADIAADATMGSDTSYADNPSKWTDATHPNAAGCALLEPYYRTLVNGA